MKLPPIPANEIERMRELVRLELLDTDAESQFNEIVSIASYITGCPISLISLIDTDRQWFKARVGLDAEQTSRDISFCGHAIASDELFVVENATLDERFADNPLVQNDPSIRFYAGQPLVTSNGFRIGTLCAIDRVPKALTEAQKTMFGQLAKHAMQLMEMRIARRRIEEKEVQFAMLADSIPQLAWMARADGHIYWYNRNWYDYTGTRSEEMEGWGWREVHHPHFVDEVVNNWSNCVAKGEPFTMEFPLRNAAGEYRWFMTRAAPVRNSEGKVTGWIGSNNDIQDQMNSIQDLKRERDMREQFVATLTHDLRTPMTLAKMSAQLLERTDFPATEAKDLARRIAVSMDRADTMISNLLDANRIRAGQDLPLELETVRADQVVAAALEDLRAIHGPRFEFRNVLGAPEVVWDAKGVRRAVENLAGNAIKYGAPNSIVTLQLGARGDRVEISVHNVGNALSAAEQEQIFAAYRRTDSARASGNAGWGIGLALVRAIAQAHGGDVTVHSSVAEGTTFTVSLPKHATRTKTPVSV